MLSVQTRRSIGAIRSTWRRPIAWLGLLAWASVRFARGPRTTTSWIFASGIAVQLALHLVVGRETFLYALHFQPLLVAFAATVVERRRRRLRWRSPPWRRCCSRPTTSGPLPARRRRSPSGGDRWT
ncbi:MAG: hypothetical protein U0610_01305 [bacterium]